MVYISTASSAGTVRIFLRPSRHARPSRTAGGHTCLTQSNTALLLISADSNFAINSAGVPKIGSHFASVSTTVVLRGEIAARSAVEDSGHIIDRGTGRLLLAVASLQLISRRPYFCCRARKYSRMAATPLVQTCREGLVRGLPCNHSVFRLVSWPNASGRAVSLLFCRCSDFRLASRPNASGRAVSWLLLRYSSSGRTWRAGR